MHSKILLVFIAFTSIACNADTVDVLNAKNNYYLQAVSVKSNYTIT